MRRGIPTGAALRDRMAPVTGTLGLFSLVDLFQLLSAAKRTGRLAVEHPAGLARIYFDRGQVVHAEFGELHGEEAVYALFRDERGGFEFRIGLPSPTNSIEVNTENLVLEGVRRLDESRRGASEEHAVSRDAVPVVPPDGMARNVTLTPDEQRVLALVDGRRSVTRIALDLGIEPEAALLVCDRLVRTGVLKLQNRRARTARLVTRLSTTRLASGAVGLDPSIISAWEKVLGHTIKQVACRRDDGTVQLFTIHEAQGAGPYLELGRDTLVRADLRVNEALLVRPVTEQP